MKLPNPLLGAILLGITVQAPGCQQATSAKKETLAPEGADKKGKEVVEDKKTVESTDSAEYIANNCPACGMG